MSNRLLGLLPPLAWLALWLLSRSQYAYVLGHEVLGERRFSPPVATLVFAAGWLLMSVAMMLPGALLALRRRGWLEPLARQGPVVAFLSGFAAVWLAFGLAFAFSDLLVHARLEPSHPEVAAQLPGLALLVAGLWLLLGRFVPPPAASRAQPSNDGRARHGLLAGWRHGLRCLWSCWALMLAMAAVGHGSLPVMLLFAVLMSVARRSAGGHGDQRREPGEMGVPGLFSAPSLRGDG